MEQKNVKMVSEKEIEAIKKNKAVLNYLNAIGIKAITDEDFKCESPKPMEFIRDDQPQTYSKNIGMVVNNEKMANLIVSLVRVHVFNVQMTDKMKNLELSFFNQNNVTQSFVFVFDFTERSLKAYTLKFKTSVSEIEKELDIDLLDFDNFLLTVTASKNILKSKKYEQNAKLIEEKKQKMLSLQNEIEKLERGL